LHCFCPGLVLVC